MSVTVYTVSVLQFIRYQCYSLYGISVTVYTVSVLQFSSISTEGTNTTTLLTIINGIFK